MWVELVGRFARDERASIATVFAFSLLALLAACGLAIDYSAAYDRRTKYDSAADSAVLAAVKAARDAFVAGDNNWEAAAATAGKAVFIQNSKAILGGDAKIRKVTVAVTRTGNEFKGTLSFDATTPTSIMKLFKKPEIEISSTAQANFAIANYLDVHLLIDISTSMGIGATPADQASIAAATGCALACHFSTTAVSDNFATVRGIGARLRVDVVRDAVRNLIDELRMQRSDADQVQISIDLFDNRILPLFAASTDLDAAYAAAANIDLVTLPEPGGTNISYSLSQLASQIGTGGDGFAPTRRKSFVVLLSDGIENSVFAQPTATPGFADPLIVDPNRLATSPAALFNSNEYLQTIEPTACDAIKNANHALLTAHIQYLIPAVADARLDYIDQKLTQKSLDAFRDCASTPSLAFAAVESNEIEPMFQEILTAIMSPSDLHLTN